MEIQEGKTNIQRGKKCMKSQVDGRELNKTSLRLKKKQNLHIQNKRVSPVPGEIKNSMAMFSNCKDGE